MMFDKRDTPSLTIESVINSIKKSYSTSKGFASKLTDKYMKEMIIYEKNIFNQIQSFTIFLQLIK